MAMGEWTWMSLSWRLERYRPFCPKQIKYSTWAKSGYIANTLTVQLCKHRTCLGNKHINLLFHAFFLFAFYLLSKLNITLVQSSVGLSVCSLYLTSQVYLGIVWKPPGCVITVGFRHVEEANDRTPSGCADPDVAEWNQKVCFWHKYVVGSEHICHSLMAELPHFNS